MEGFLGVTFRSPSKGFSYSTRGHEGNTVRETLPYNPLEYGFRLTVHKNCCLYFVKDDLKLQIKTSSKHVILFKGATEVTDGIQRPNSKKTFEQIIKKWL